MPMVRRHFMKVPVQAIRKLSDTCSKPEQTSMPRQMVVVAVQSCGWPSKVLERITNLFRTWKVWVHWMLVQICNSRYDTFNNIWIPKQKVICLCHNKRYQM
jgi:hypothetical protein